MYDASLAAPSAAAHPCRYWKYRRARAGVSTTWRSGHISAAATTPNLKSAVIVQLRAVAVIVQNVAERAKRGDFALQWVNAAAVKYSTHRSQATTKRAQKALGPQILRVLGLHGVSRYVDAIEL